MPDNSLSDKEQIFRRITRYIAICIDNNLVINPYHSLSEWSELIQNRGCCPCASDRLQCPCDELLDEIEKDGQCKCTFFQTPNKFFDKLKLAYEVRLESEKSKDKKKVKKTGNEKETKSCEPLH